MALRALKAQTIKLANEQIELREYISETKIDAKVQRTERKANKSPAVVSKLGQPF